LKVMLAAINAKYIHSNLAVRYLHAHVKPEFPDTHFLEFNINQNLDVITAELLSHPHDVLGISCYIWNWDLVQKMVSDYSLVRPDTVIVLGGPEVSYDTEAHLEAQAGVDYIVRGEGEEPFLRLLRALNKTRRPTADTLASIPGVCYRAEGGTVEQPAHIMDLDKLRPPYAEGMEQLEHKILYYEASRGCPYRCSFCLSSLSGPVRHFPLQRVKEDLQELLTLDPDQIRFVDRTFNAHPQRAFELVQWMARQPTRTRFQLEITGDTLTQPLVDVFKSAPPGRFQLEIGVQSTYKEALAGVERKSDLQQLAQRVEEIRAGGSTGIMLDLIAGLPHESLGHFAASFNYVYNLDPGRIHLGSLKFLRGSELRRQYRRWGYGFQRHPPYEVLFSDAISFAELHHLQIISDLVDRCYNSGRFAWTLPWLINHFFSSPFAFYSEWAHWWKESGLHLQSHGAAALYGHLHAFLGGCRHPQYRALAALDFCLFERTKDVPDFLDVDEAGDNLKRWIQSRKVLDSFPEWEPLSNRQIQKRTRAVRLPAAVLDESGCPAYGGEPQVVALCYPDMQTPGIPVLID